MRQGRNYRVAGLLVVALLMFATCATTAIAATPTYITALQPSWTAPGGGGCYAGYYGPPGYAAVSPGIPEMYSGREAGIIKAGINVDGDGHYYDEGLLGFQVPSVPIAVFATRALSFDVANESGARPVWVRIRFTNGTQYQHVPTSNPTGWHTVNAAAGMWQMMDPVTWGGTGPLLTLSGVAGANPSAMVDRVYLTLGQGDSYHDNPDGTVAWVDKVVINATMYDFVITAPSQTISTPASSAWSLVLLALLGGFAAVIGRSRRSSRMAA